MAKEIRTKAVLKDIRALDRAAETARHMKMAYVRTREQTGQTQGEENAPEGYAVEKVAGTAKRMAQEIGRQAKAQAGKTPHQPKKSIPKTAFPVHAGERAGESAAQKKKADGKEAEQRREAGKNAATNAKKQATENRDAAKQAEERGKGSGQRAVRTLDRGEKTIKTGEAGQNIKSTGKGAVKSASRTVKHSGRTVKTAGHHAEKVCRRAGHSAENAQRACQQRTCGAMARKSAGAGKKAGQMAERAAKRTMKSIKAMAKAAMAGTKALAAFFVAGGWAALLILIIVLLFGGLFSMTGGDNSATVMPVSEEVKAYEPVIRKYAKQHGIVEYVELLKAVMMQESGGKGNDPMQSSQGSFNTKYPHKANAIPDPEYSIECGVQELKSCLEAAKAENPTDIDHIRLALQGYNYGNGYIAWAVENFGGYTLANAAEFSDKMAKEKHLKKYGDRQYVPHVLRYYSFGRMPSGAGNGAIVQVALSQEGNGGTTYWSWYGFQKRVSWCACFVSWCADQCGYIENGVMPKFSLCSDGVKQFQARKQFMDGSYVPKAGDIIFFDWGKDGSINHVGIVESVTKGTVNTVEGNSGDRVKRHSYPVGDGRIYGYGVPTYNG